MYRSVLAATALLASSSAFADENKVSAGFGFKYGGALGVKYAPASSENSRVFAAAGLVGGAVGYEYTLNDKNAITLSLGSEIIVSEKGFVMLEYNHYFQGKNNACWRIGGGFGITREDPAVHLQILAKQTPKGISVLT